MGDGSIELNFKSFGGRGMFVQENAVGVGFWEMGFAESQVSILLNFSQSTTVRC